MKRCVWIEGREANTAIGHEALEHRTMYPITWMEYVGPHGKMRVQIMDRGRCYLCFLTLARLITFPETDYLTGGIEDD